MTTYADDIEQADDSAARKAHIEAMFGNTKMAALMAATDGGTTQETAGLSAPENRSPNGTRRQRAAGRSRRGLIIK